MIGFRKIIVNVVCWRQQVKSGINAEQYHFYDTALGRCFRNGRIVGAYSNMADFSGSFQLLYILQVITACGLFPVAFGIDKVHHAQINVIGLQPGQKILKGSFTFLYVSGAYILAVLPGGTDMALYVPFFTASFQCVSKAGTYIGLRHPAI